MSISSSRRLHIFSLAFTTVLLAPSAASAEGPPVELGGTLALASDYVFRGVSQTMGRTALQAGADAAMPGGVTLYGWASNVDFTAPGDPDDGADVEIDLGINVELDIGAAGLLQGGLVRYLYPDVAPGVDYDYTEWLLVWTFRERLCAELTYSDDVFGVGEPGWAWQVGWTQPLFERLSLAITYGRYELDQAYGSDYGYGEITLSREIGPVTVALAYSDTSAGADALFPAATIGDRFVASVELSLR